jgi:hypothetical protein
VQLVRPTLADDVGYRPGLHPEHPAAVEGCRPVSRGLMLELVTMDKITFMSVIVKTKGLNANYSRLARRVNADPSHDDSLTFFSNQYFQAKQGQESKLSVRQLPMESEVHAR